MLRRYVYTLQAEIVYDTDDSESCSPETFSDDDFKHSWIKESVHDGNYVITKEEDLIHVEAPKKS